MNASLEFIFEMKMRIEMYKDERYSSPAFLLEQLERLEKLMKQDVKTLNEQIIEELKEEGKWQIRGTL